MTNLISETVASLSAGVAFDTVANSIPAENFVGYDGEWIEILFQDRLINIRWDGAVEMWAKDGQSRVHYYIA